jgi:hypothetical protein
VGETGPERGAYATIPVVRNDLTTRIVCKRPSQDRARLIGATVIHEDELQIRGLIPHAADVLKPLLELSHTKFFIENRNHDRDEFAHLISTHFVVWVAPS